MELQCSDFGTDRNQDVEVSHKHVININIIIALILFAAIECPALAFPANGFNSFDLDITAPYSFLTTVTYGCNAGFGITGGDRTRQCGSSSAGPGVWIGRAPICQGMG